MYDHEIKYAILIKNIWTSCKRSSSERRSDIFIQRSKTFSEWSYIDQKIVRFNIFGIIHTRYDFLEWNYCKRLLLEELQVNRVKNDLCTSSWSPVTILFWFCFLEWAILGLGSVNIPKAKTCWANKKQIFQSETFYRFQTGLIRSDPIWTGYQFKSIQYYS